jgi:hypothetical protein
MSSKKGSAADAGRGKLKLRKPTMATTCNGYNRAAVFVHTACSVQVQQLTWRKPAASRKHASSMLAAYGEYPEYACSNPTSGVHVQGYNRHTMWSFEPARVLKLTCMGL